MTGSSAARRGLTADGLIAKANAEQLAGVIADKLRGRYQAMGRLKWQQWVSSELSRMQPLLRSMVRAALEAKARGSR
jgi:hypothetical protein